MKKTVGLRKLHQKRRSLENDIRAVKNSSLVPSMGEFQQQVTIISNHTTQINSNTTVITTISDTFTYEDTSQDITITNAELPNINQTITDFGRYIIPGVTINLKINDTPTFPIDNAAAVDKGGGLVGIPSTGHPLSSGEWFSIEGTTNYNGYYVADSATSTNEIVIEATYVAETFSGANIREPIVMTETILVSGFYGGGQIFITATNPTAAGEALKNVLLDLSGVSGDGVLIELSNSRVNIQHVAVRFNSNGGYRGIHFTDCPTKNSAFNCLVMGNSVDDGECFRVNGSMCTIRKCYVIDAHTGIKSEGMGQVASSNNSSTQTQVKYGLRANMALIYKGGTQPTGSVADENATGGGIIS